MDKAAQPQAIAGATPAVLAVSAMALVFLSNAEMAFVPPLQVTAYRYVLYALIALMVANWVELLAWRVMLTRDNEGQLAAAGLYFAAEASPRAQMLARRAWMMGISLAAAMAAVMLGCAGYGRQFGRVPVYVIEFAIVLLATPAAAAFALSSLWRRGFLPA